MTLPYSPGKCHNGFVPIFDFRCPSCTTVSRDVLLAKGEESPKCCGSTMEKVFLQGSKFHPFKEGWYEHIASEPIYIASKKQLRQETESRGQYSEYARD